MNTISQEAKSALIEALRKETITMQVPQAGGNMKVVSMHDIVEIVESFPVSDGWIPVSERLPEERVPVLVRMSYGKFDVCYRLAETFVQDVRPQHSNGGVTHWQPLPKSPTK